MGGTRKQHSKEFNGKVALEAIKGVQSGEGSGKVSELNSVRDWEWDVNSA